MRAVLRDPPLDPAFKELVLTLPSRDLRLRAARPCRRPAARPRRPRAMRGQLARAPARRLGAGLGRRTRSHGGYSPTGVVRARAARWPTWRWPCWCATPRARGDAVWPGKALPALQGRRQHDRPPRRARRAGERALGAGRAGAGALPRAVPATRRWSSTSGSACRRARPSRTAACSPACKPLLQHPDFSMNNPNRVRSLLLSLCNFNPAAFHRADAKGYVFWAEKVRRARRASTRRSPRASRARSTAGATSPSRTAARRARPSRAWPPQPT